MTAAGFGWGLPVNIWDLEAFQTGKGGNDCTFDVYHQSLPSLPSPISHHTAVSQLHGHGCHAFLTTECRGQHTEIQMCRRVHLHTGTQMKRGVKRWIPKRAENRSEN